LSVVSCPLYVLNRLSSYVESDKPVKLDQRTTDN
jgi:hypothetical protein